jgi:hypothetical protein
MDESYEDEIKLSQKLTPDAEKDDRQDTTDEDDSEQEKSDSTDSDSDDDWNFSDEGNHAKCNLIKCKIRNYQKKSQPHLMTNWNSKVNINQFS